MLRAPVHVNKQSNLVLISNLIEETFGIQKPRSTSKWIGTCLVAQVAFTISAITGMKPMVISKHILREFGSEGDKFGFTIEEILRTFDAPVLTRKGPVWINLELSAYDSVETMLNAIICGHPTLLIMGREVCDALETEAMAYKDGCSYATVIRPAAEGSYHSFLAIGYEMKTDPYPNDFLIVRDSRHVYSYKGYLKIGINTLDQGCDFIRALSVNVLSVEH